MNGCHSKEKEDQKCGFKLWSLYEFQGKCIVYMVENYKFGKWFIATYLHATAMFLLTFDVKRDGGIKDKNSADKCKVFVGRIQFGGKFYCF